MAIFQKTEPGLLYELSPGRDGRLLVWSPGLMKYQYCTTLEDLADVNSNYLEQDIDDGCWFYQLPRLENGDNMFYNEDDGRVPLWHFESNLQSLQSGVNMFKGCSLDAASVKRIADTLPAMSTGTITLGIHYSLEGDSGVAASLAKIESKGWSVEVEYNLPYGFTELEYLESPTTEDMNVTSYFALPINNKPGRDTLRIVSEHYVPSIPSVVSMEGIGHNLCAFHTLCYSINSKKFFFSYDGSEPYPLADVNLYYTFPVGEWATYETFRGAEEVSFSVNGSIAVRNTVEWSSEALENQVIGCFGRIAIDVGYTDFGQYGRKRSWKLYHNSALLYDLRPVLDAEGTPCMFDRVSCTCFYNKGMGTFGYKVKRTGEEVAPSGITVLEYLEASGTQCIETGLTVNASNGASVEWSMNTKTDYANVLSVSNADSAGRPINAGGFYVPYWNGVSAKFLAVFMDLGENNYTLDEEVQLNTKYVSNLNWLNDHKITLNNKLMGSIPEDVTSYECANPVLFGSSRNGDLLNVARLNGKIYRARISENDVVIHDFIPVLMRKTTTVAEGTTTRDVTEYIPGMYDKVTGQFYANNGSGTFGYRVLHQETEVEPTTFSLRDPYYVAPSGVYARLVAENELDIVADTDITDDIAEQEGYIWFANTGEAYEHFGITQQSDGEEVIDA